MAKSRLILLFALLLCGVVLHDAHATDQSSGSFKNLDSTFVPAVFDISSPGNFKIFGSVESIVGLSSSASYIVRHGVTLKEIVAVTPPPPSGGGGVGGGGPIPSPTAPQAIISLSGSAYPFNKVFLLKDGQLVATAMADAMARFTLTLGNLTTGTYTFTLYSQDLQGQYSAPFSLTVSVKGGTTSIFAGIFIAPTVNIDKLVVKQGDLLAIYGQTVPQGKVTIWVNSVPLIVAKTIADANGVYVYRLNTKSLKIGSHYIDVQIAIAGTNQLSQFSQRVFFDVSLTASFPAKPQLCLKADLNCDGRVDLVDFSIAAYWYNHTLSSGFAAIEKSRLNGDGKIDIADFSVMAYYWTG